MIRRIKWHKTPFFLTLALLIFHLFGKDFNNPYERPIAGDAQAYYAYLPAAFIYQDFSYKFVDTINEKYYPESHQKSFLKPAGEGKVNKTFPGVALLYLPFFLIAHFLALLFGLEADGYSTIYQICFDLGLWVYLYLGLMGLIKVLKKMAFSNAVANWSSVILLLGTNMVFYTVYDQSVTHIYNFFMINWFIYQLLVYQEKGGLKPLVIAAFLIALIGITRPTNILVFGLVLFFIPDPSFYKKLFLDLFRVKNLIPITLVSLAVLSIPFLLWKIQTNSWVVYSYGEEGFDFANPQWSSFLFSYLKGWFTYSPFVLIILLIGLPLLFKTCKKRFVIAIGFYIISTYVFSSWWCWYYGAGMGQRVMIDHFILLAFILALILQKLNIDQPSLNIKSAALTTVSILLIAFNFGQAYQIRHGILTGGSATAEQYWDNFLVFEKRARVYPHEHWTLEGEENADLSENSTALLKGHTYVIENTWSTEVSAYENYSASVGFNISNLRKGSKLIIGFDARARTAINETRAVLYLDDAFNTFGLDNYAKTDEWIHMEFIVEPKTNILSVPSLFFWNGGTAEKVEIKNLWAKHYFSDSYL